MCVHKHEENLLCHILSQCDVLFSHNLHQFQRKSLKHKISHAFSLVTNWMKQTRTYMYNMTPYKYYTHKQNMNMYTAYNSFFQAKCVERTFEKCPPSHKKKQWSHYQSMETLGKRYKVPCNFHKHAGSTWWLYNNITETWFNCSCVNNRWKQKNLKNKNTVTMERQQGYTVTNYTLEKPVPWAN